MSPQDSFSAFWAAYPRRVKRKYALSIWLKLRPDHELLDRILTALEWQRQLPEWQDTQYVPHPSSWLNGERWTDEPPEVRSRFDKPHAPTFSEMKAKRWAS